MVSNQASMILLTTVKIEPCCITIKRGFTALYQPLKSVNFRSLLSAFPTARTIKLINILALPHRKSDYIIRDCGTTDTEKMNRWLYQGYT